MMYTLHVLAFLLIGVGITIVTYGVIWPRPVLTKPELPIEEPITPIQEKGLPDGDQPAKSPRKRTKRVGGKAKTARRKTARKN